MPKIYSGHREEAKRTLNHYFQLLAKRAGVPWTSDSVAEIESIVDSIVDAAVAEARL